MQITTNFLVDFLINLYKYKNAHQDFIVLNNKKLNILLKHLNIENCINFEKNTRSVQTISSLQVRQKMYQGSSDAWKKYWSHIQPLISALEKY